MKPIILAFAGGIASGKSTLSLNVANTLGWKHLGFGNYIRDIAFQNDTTPSRENLQQTGEKLINELGWEKFCINFLKNGKWYNKNPLIIEGVRHIEILEALTKITSPYEVLLVFISLNYNERLSRLKERDNWKKNNLKKYDSHSTEIQINSKLKEIADLYVDGHKSIKNLTKEIISWLNQV